MAYLKEICIARKADGSRCKMRAWSEADEQLCQIHHKQHRGLKMPSQMRKKQVKTRAGEWLKLMKMPKEQLEAIREVFPEIDEILFNNHNAHDSLDLLARVMSMKVIATDDTQAMKCLLMLTRYLDKLSLNDQSLPSKDRVPDEPEIDLFDD